MKIKKLTFAALAALAVALSFQTSITRAGDDGPAVAPSNPFVILLEGTYESPAGVVPDLFPPQNLNNGKYKTVPIYNIDSGVPGPTDKVVGNFYAFGGDGIVTYDLRKGALRAKFIPELEDTEVISDGAGGIYINGTYELDILEAAGIYRSFAGGHIHMVDVLQLTAAGLFVEHCFCYISREHGKP